MKNSTKQQYIVKQVHQLGFIFVRGVHFIFQRCFQDLSEYLEKVVIGFWGRRYFYDVGSISCGGEEEGHVVFLSESEFLLGYALFNL